jgi:hypothetical protein
MKKYLLILFVSFCATFSVFAQTEDGDNNGGKLQERMREYIQKRLSLTKNEADKFSPVFMRYLLELRRTHRENISDKPMLQLKIAEVRVRYRNEFRQILDEQRANKVFECQKEFEIKIRTELNNRRSENRPPRARIRSLLR